MLHKATKTEKTTTSRKRKAGLAVSTGVKKVVRKVVAKKSATRKVVKAKAQAKVVVASVQKSAKAVKQPVLTVRKNVDGILIRRSPVVSSRVNSAPAASFKTPAVVPFFTKKSFNFLPKLLAKGFSLVAVTLLIVMVTVPFFQAFEAHVLNVTAEVFNIDPPVLTIPGDIGWDNPNGGAGLSGNQDIVMSDADVDATHIFYTYGPGTDPNVIPNPVCGGSNGGPKGLPQHLVINSDTTIKAVACDGPGAGAHRSLINTKIYTFTVPCQDRFIPLDIIIVFDKSGSMSVGGKLAAAKTAAKKFVDLLDPTRDQVGLVSFSSTAALSKQLTTDFVSVKNAISNLSAGGSTNIGDPIDKANLELESSRARSNSTKVEILLTDGRANRPGTTDDNPTAMALAVAKANEAAANGFILYTIGLGNDVNAPFLTGLAESTGGQYFSSLDIGQLSDIYGQITHLICGSSKVSGIKFNDLNQNGQKDLNEPAVPGWRITLKHGSGTFGTALTDVNGHYEFSDLPANVEFTLEEEARSGWQAINPSNGKITVTLNEAQNLENQDFANFEIGQQCTSDTVSFPENVAVLAAGDSTGGLDDISAAIHVTVNGKLQSNENVNAIGGSTSRNVNGDIVAGGVVNTPANFTVSGGHSILEHQAPTILPDLQLNTWKTKAASGGTVNGSLIFPANTSGIDLGPSEILGNVSFGSNNEVNLKGPLYIHGNLTLGSNTKITQDSSFGNNFAIIIVDGTINLGSNSKFFGSGTSGAFLLVSTALASSSGSIQTASNANLERVVLFATEGNIHVNANAEVLALFAKHGFSAGSPAIVLEFNTTVNGGVLPGQIVCGPSVSPDKNLEHVVINEFIPNPSGSDNAPKPGGEWVELYNNSGSSVDVAGWVLTSNLTQILGAAQNKTWGSAVDFAGGNFTNTFVENTGNERVRVTTGNTSGSFQQVFDTGSGKKGDWQNISWSEQLSVGADICVQAATSDDGVTYSAYSASDCNSPFNLSSLPDSRFLKWKTTHSRTTSLVTNNADLLDLTLSYKPISFNELVISNFNTDTGSTVIPSFGYLVVYRNGNTEFDLGNSSGSVNLYNGEPLAGSSKIDSHVYNYSGGAPEGKSFTRMPDGTANWIDPEATPGEANDEFLSASILPTEEVAYTSPVVEAEPEVLPPQPGESDYIEGQEEESSNTDALQVTGQEDVDSTSTTILENIPAVISTGGGSSGGAAESVSGEVSVLQDEQPATGDSIVPVKASEVIPTSNTVHDDPSVAPSPTPEAATTPEPTRTPATDPSSVNQSPPNGNSGSGQATPVGESLSLKPSEPKPEDAPKETAASAPPPSTEPQTPADVPVAVDAPASN